MILQKLWPARQAVSIISSRHIGPQVQFRSLATTQEHTPSLQDAVQAAGPRTNWTREEISSLYNSPLMELSYAAVGP